MDKLQPSSKWKRIDDKYQAEAEQCGRVQAIPDGGLADNGLSKDDETLRIAHISRQLNSMISDTYEQQMEDERRWLERNQ